MDFLFSDIFKASAILSYFSVNCTQNSNISIITSIELEWKLFKHMMVDCDLFNRIPNIARYFYHGIGKLADK